MMQTYVPLIIRQQENSPISTTERREIIQHAKCMLVIVGALATVAAVYMHIKCIREGGCINNDVELILDSNV